MRVYANKVVTINVYKIIQVSIKSLENIFHIKNNTYYYQRTEKANSLVKMGLFGISYGKGTISQQGIVSKVVYYKLENCLFLIQFIVLTVNCT